MVRRGARRRVERSDWTTFLAAAEENYLGACALQETRKYRAAGILFVHAAIALTDALTVRSGGVKSTGERHQEAIDLVRDFLPTPAGSARPCATWRGFSTRRIASRIPGTRSPPVTSLACAPITNDSLPGPRTNSAPDTRCNFPFVGPESESYSPWRPGYPPLPGGEFGGQDLFRVGVGNTPWHTSSPPISRR